MLDLIFTIKFVHVIAAAAMFGGWLSIAVFMLLAHRSGNPSVVALTSQFAVSADKMIVAPALVVLPLSGFPLGDAIGISPLHELWVDLSLALYAVTLACWIAALRVEIRIREVAREAALNATPLPAAYRKLFRLWSMLAAPILVGTIFIFALMIWQPRLD